MSIIKVIKCDVCGKEEILNDIYRNLWFVENINHSVCSRECFEKQFYSEVIENESNR